MCAWILDNIIAMIKWMVIKIPNWLFCFKNITIIIQMDGSNWRVWYENRDRQGIR